MNIEVWEKLISYTNPLVSAMNKHIIRPLFKSKWTPPLRDLLTTFQCYLEKMLLSKRPTKINHSVNFCSFGCKKRTDLFRLGDTKSRNKATRAVSTMWFITPKRRLHTQKKQVKEITI